MAVLSTRVDPGSPEFAQNRAEMLALVEEVRGIEAKVRAHGERARAPLWHSAVAAASSAARTRTTRPLPAACAPCARPCVPSPAPAGRVWAAWWRRRQRRRHREVTPWSPPLARA